MTGSEAIKLVGKEFVSDFDIESESLREAYRATYQNFIDGLNLDKKTKGLLIIGSIGCGKSIMMKVVQKLFKDSPRAFKWVTGTALRDMMDDLTVSEIKERYGYDCKMDLYIDDIGVNEAVTRKYGNGINIISEILMERYELFITEGFKTHLSTNLVPKKGNDDTPNLENVYGLRVYDRIKEMCQLVTIKSKSLRK